MTKPAETRQHPQRYAGEFVRVVIGSTIHGLSVAGTDDLDLMGIRIESAQEALGLGQPFEQYVWRTQPEGEPSGPGDVDLTVYSLRKWLRLAANGNPTILNLLFVPRNYREIDGVLATDLRGLTSKIISREAGFRYQGYLRAQRERLLGLRGGQRTGSTRRERYVAEFGFDVKFAGHMIRLGVQGVELLQTGHLELPIPEPRRSEILAVRLGEVALDECIKWAESLENTLERLCHEADLPEHPDREHLNKWLAQTYVEAWK